MDKKMYFEPEMEEILLNTESVILAGSPTDVDEDDNSAPSGDGSNPGNPWG